MIRLSRRSWRSLCVLIVKLGTLAGYLFMMTGLMRWSAGQAIMAIQCVCAACALAAVIIAIRRREQLLGAGFNHWGEAMVFCLFSLLAAVSGS